VLTVIHRTTEPKYEILSAENHFGGNSLRSANGPISAKYKGTGGSLPGSRKVPTVLLWVSD
jgi:hypothetical protein